MFVYIMVKINYQISCFKLTLLGKRKDKKSLTDILICRNNVITSDCMSWHIMRLFIQTALKSLILRNLANIFADIFSKVYCLSKCKKN